MKKVLLGLTTVFILAVARVEKIYSFLFFILMNFVCVGQVVWTTNPNFSGTNKAYDIDWDYQGNVYIYGGQYPFQFSKLDSLGVMQWTFTNNTFWSNDYGDFAIDRNSGTAYICDGADNSTGARVLKINTLGNQSGLSVPNNQTPQEFWRIAYNSCTHKGVIGAGGIYNIYGACTFDTNLVITPVNILSTNEYYHDVCLLTIDDTYAYMAFARTSGSSLFDNVLLKSPLSTLQPLTYIINDGHHFKEDNSVLYYAMKANGYNGIAKNNNYIYSYDGARIIKRNALNGGFINSTIISVTDSFQCGGIAVDGCNNIYVGCVSGVKLYDSTLTYISSVNTVGAVYDVAIGRGNKVYACGNGFVTSFLGIDCKDSACLTLSINENENNSSGLTVSPNPFSTQTTLQTDNPLHNATLTVYNSQGQQVKQFVIRNSSSFVIRRDNLPSGLYFIRLTTPSPKGEGWGEVIAVDKLVITDQ